MQYKTMRYAPARARGPWPASVPPLGASVPPPPHPPRPCWSGIAAAPAAPGPSPRPGGWSPHPSLPTPRLRLQLLRAVCVCCWTVTVSHGAAGWVIRRGNSQQEPSGVGLPSLAPSIAGCCRHEQHAQHRSFTRYTVR
jgi:hypothetical protein